ncbi:hypothetical protein K7432_006213 [Basidiobolus ranarum]|uniref:Ribosomal protein L2 n=1 Tax=Basidiobolus ranarum TaxID=34480 RepID=A0ABR2WVD0_9FUNG
MTYTYKRKGKGAVQFKKNREIRIHGIKAKPGNSPNPGYGRITGSNPYVQESQESPNEVSSQVDYGATWAYRMVKSLLVNQLL